MLANLLFKELLTLMLVFKIFSKLICELKSLNSKLYNLLYSKICHNIVREYCTLFINSYTIGCAVAMR